MCLGFEFNAFMSVYYRTLKKYKARYTVYLTLLIIIKKTKL